ncbi:MAG: DNA-binding protein [Caulobacteraceae bacterium]|nr:DNA-binding protein [Caulobacteraceae bacterium]
MTAREAAKHLVVTSRAVRYMIARGELVAQRRGDGWRISTASVRKRLRAMR